MARRAPWAPGRRWSPLPTAATEPVAEAVGLRRGTIPSPPCRVSVWTLGSQSQISFPPIPSQPWPRQITPTTSLVVEIPETSENNVIHVLALARSLFVRISVGGYEPTTWAGPWIIICQFYVGMTAYPDWLILSAFSFSLAIVYSRQTA